MFQLSIVTPEEVYCELEASSLYVPGTEGYMGVLSHHAPLITSLTPGKIEFRDSDGNEQSLAVSGGFLEVSDNKATILADAVEKIEDIDIDRAKAAMDRAKKRIDDGARNSEINVARARASMARAMNRIYLSRR